MSMIVAIGLLAMQLLGSEVAPAPAAPPPPPPLLMPRISDEAIRLAVHAALAEHAALQNPRRYEVDTLRTDKFQAFAIKFAEAKVPDCLHEDGLLRQPTGIGPFRLGGLNALPFVLIAKLRGKCL